MSRNYGSWKVYLAVDGIHIVSMRDLGAGSWIVMDERDFVEMVLEQAGWYGNPPPQEAERLEKLNEGRK